MLPKIDGYFAPGIAEAYYEDPLLSVGCPVLIDRTVDDFAGKRLLPRPRREVRSGVVARGQDQVTRLVDGVPCSDVPSFIPQASGVGFLAETWPYVETPG